ncbi:FAD:protein FMN transferase [Algibacter sp. L1A34]|uniref:FAD:protein FMN transferase n=1 Tax=Algibacter sp. L1A34 TaxID=2686365 RepID=UPI00131CB3E0|nr:FAD:protein FMN transferase [Algibacter sp. L1A34]
MNKLKFVILCLMFAACKQSASSKEIINPENTRIEGSVFGTFYQVTCGTDVNYEKQLDSLFFVINKSMSTYIPDSDISKLNRNESIDIDNHFKTVFENSEAIYKATNGAFDPTIGAVVNAWDFGPEGKIIDLDSLKINNLMQSVGLNKVKLVNSKIIKPKGTFLDFNAIAKGYGVDVVGRFLESKNVKNYLINIGGELRARGSNKASGKVWTVGVENPNFNGTQSINKVLFLKDKSMATSGTYRKFKVDENGNRYAHIIDTKTGYPSKTNLLSISVIADNCMTADAYATAFKAMGIEKVKVFLEGHSELKVFLIFENDEKEFETLTFNGFGE